ncbi:MAG: TIGR01777 family oxidoreductase, partial [Pseudomonadota bacterium]|nr:TIGR01777 family oxidoreductase [Pseudomonadota bacterium]
MHVLMTGGTGLIGAATVTALKEKGATVTVLTRRPTADAPRVEYITSLSQCEGPVDAVINLAGAGLADRRWTRAYKQEILESRVGLTGRLVDWMRAQSRPPERLISASAIGYYGASEDGIFSEEAPSGAGFSAELCRQWEDEAVCAQELGTVVTRLRLGVVFSSRGGALGKMTQANQLGVESWLGTGSQWLSWVHITDVVRAIQFVLERDAPAPVYNLVAPEAATHRTFAREVAMHKGSMLRLGVPAFAVRWLAGEMAD